MAQQRGSRRAAHVPRAPRASLPLVPLLCLLAAWCMLAPPASASGGGTEISPSVMMIGHFDWAVERVADGSLWSRCLDQLWRATERGASTQINFVPTHHWLPPGGGGNNGGSVGGYCLMQDNGDGGGAQCVPWTDALVTEFTGAMRLCFAEALGRDLEITISPHLDDGTLNGAWRNGLLFRPREKYAGASYWDIMLAPLADALKGALEDTKGQRGGGKPTIYFGMQGEMSATVMRLPGDWLELVAPLRARVGALANVKMGIGLNFNRLDDTSSTGQTFSSSRVSWLMWATGASDIGSSASAPPLDADGVARLLGALDFVGVSAYAPISGAGFNPNELGNAAFNLGDEFKAMGVDFRDAVSRGALELHYSEFGLGGGGRYSGSNIAANPSEVALRPFFGIYGPYRASADPWSIPANRAFLCEFYSKAAAWLADPSQQTYRVSKVFVWSLASWDVLGIYPESTTSEGSYYDPQVGRIVRGHNAAVRARGDGGGKKGGDDDDQPPAAGK